MGTAKTIFQSTLGKIASALPTKSLFKLTKQPFVLPFYHGISNQKLPHTENLYRVKSTKDFIADLDFLLQHFEPVDFKGFLERNQNLTKKYKPYFLLSFDDGLKEVKETIAPILQSKGIPAMVFLNSDFVDNQALFFRYKASLLIEEINNSKSIKNAAIDFLQTEDVFSKLLAIRHYEQEQLNQFAQYIGYSFEDFLEKEKPYLTKKEILELQQQDFHFGAHSANHPEYQYLPLEEQLIQTEESLSYVKDEIDIQSLSFSFPFTDFGVSQEFFTALHESEEITATFGCAGMKQDSALNHFQRIAFEEKQRNAKEILNAEMLYYLLKNPIGKNRIIRS